MNHQFNPVDKLEALAPAEHSLQIYSATTNEFFNVPIPGCALWLLNSEQELYALLQETPCAFLYEGHMDDAVAAEISAALTTPVVVHWNGIREAWQISITGDAKLSFDAIEHQLLYVDGRVTPAPSSPNALMRIGKASLY